MARRIYRTKAKQPSPTEHLGSTSSRSIITLSKHQLINLVSWTDLLNSWVNIDSKMPENAQKLHKSRESYTLESPLQFISYLLRLEAGRVEVGVEEDDGEGQDEGGVGGRVQLGHEVGVALAVPLAEHLHQPLDLLRLAGHAEVCLELAEG